MNQRTAIIRGPDIHLARQTPRYYISNAVEYTVVRGISCRLVSISAIQARIRWLKALTICWAVTTIFPECARTLSELPLGWNTFDKMFRLATWNSEASIGIQLIYAFAPTRYLWSTQDLFEVHSVLRIRHTFYQGRRRGFHPRTFFDITDARTHIFCANRTPSTIINTPNCSYFWPLIQKFEEATKRFGNKINLHRQKSTQVPVLTGHLQFRSLFRVVQRQLYRFTLVIIFLNNY